MIERIIFDDRLATAAYITADWEPADRAHCDLIKIIFEDNMETIFVYPQMLEDVSAFTDKDWDESKVQRAASAPGHSGGEFSSFSGGGGDKQTSTKEFKAWFGESKVVDDDGEPLRVFHGTTANFESFSRARANPEGNWGAGFYFTDEPGDVGVNYASSEGPDIKNRIEQEVDRLVNEGMLEEEARPQVMAEHVEHEGVTIPVYLRIEKPFQLGNDEGEPSTVLDYESNYDEEADEYGEPTGKLVEFIEALRENARGYDEMGEGDIDKVIAEIQETGMDGGLTAGQLDKIMRSNEGMIYLSDENKNMATEIYRRSLADIGFDGVIDRTVSDRFNRMKGMNKGTAHYIVFDPNQIKSSLANKGTFSKTSENILAKASEKPLDLRNSVKLPTQTGYIDISEPGTGDRLIELHVNPSLSMVKRLARESTSKTALGKPELTVRVLRDAEGNVYVWRAEDAIHLELQSTLIDKYGIRDTDQSQWWMHDGELGGEFPRSGTGQHAVYVKQAKEWIAAGQETASHPDIAEGTALGTMAPGQIRSSIDKVAKEHSFPSDMIGTHEGDKIFDLNGKKYFAAGIAYTSKDFDKQKKDDIFKTMIVLYNKQLSPASIDGLLSHEIEHIKYQTAINRYQEEYKKVMAEPGAASMHGPDAVMKADGSLHPPYDKKYPAYTAMHEAFFSKNGIKEFAESDGVSDYSYEWWKNWKEKSGSGEYFNAGQSAIHETLAEMARIKYETGKFPEHMGERIISWRGGVDVPKPSKAQMEKNAKLWRNLYRAVETAWKAKP